MIPMNKEFKTKIEEEEENETKINPPEAHRKHDESEIKIDTFGEIK